MRITIFAAGSRGDIQPCLLLGRDLEQAGYEVLLAAPENFGDFVREYGVPFYPLRGDVQQIMASETGRSFMENGSTNFIQQIRAMRSLLGPVALQMASDALAACREADALLALAVFAPFAKSIAEIQGIPLIHMEPTPLLPTCSFAAPGWPVQANLGRLHNRLSGFGMLQVIWQWYRPFVNQFRWSHRLAPLPAGSFYHILASTPLLGAYSSRVIPHPPDWPDSMHITGYWFPDAPEDWQPPAELEAFLAAGDSPVYVGFGSMAGRAPEQLAQIVIAALAKSGQRGVLLTGWGGLRTLSVPESVFVIDSAPHACLFPRMAAVVHHGGAGTTAEGLRAGVPSIILPFMMDQPFWGKRIQALGLGPAPIPQKHLTSDRLASAIHTAVSDAGMRQRARACGEALRAENGRANAVNIIQHYWGDPNSSRRKQPS